jgi:uncharacterized membrane protein YkoI
LLEDRWLLSGFTLPLHPDAAVYSGLGVRAIDQLGAASPEAHHLIEVSPPGEDSSTARVIAIEKLPHQIVAAVLARFPGAGLLSAEVDTADGLAIFDVTAQFGGARLDITLSNDGDVIEMEQPLAAADLPQLVRDWVGNHFPGASIQEAALVVADGALRYEVMIAKSTPESFDAAIALPATDSGSVHPSSSLADPLVESLARANASGHTTGADAFASEAGETVATAQEVRLKVASVPDTAIAKGRHPSAAQDPLDPGLGAIEGPTSDDSRDTNSIARASGKHLRTTSSHTASPSSGLGTVISMIADVVPVTWLPQLAQPLDDVFPIGIAAIEQGLQEFLDEVESLAQSLAPGRDANRVTSRLWIAAATLLGAERVISELKKTNRSPVLVSAAGKSTWTWVLNLSGTVSRLR